MNCSLMNRVTQVFLLTGMGLVGANAAPPDSRPPDYYQVSPPAPQLAVPPAESNSWMSAYISSVEAIKALPDHPEAARQSLRETAARLQGLPEAQEIADRALDLSRNDRLSANDLYDLIDSIGAHLSSVGNP